MNKEARHSGPLGQPEPLPGPGPGEEEGTPALRSCCPQGPCDAHRHPEEMAWTKAMPWEAVQIEPIGLDPLPPHFPVPSTHSGDWEGQTLSQAPLAGYAARGGSGLWNGEEAWPRGTRRAPTGGPPCPATRTPASPSAPGVPGGSATAEAVAALPRAVDEAQGVLELLAGAFLDGLVGEVHLRRGGQSVRATESLCTR